MSGSRPFPTPVPAAETLAQWQRQRGAGWLVRDDGKMFAPPAPPAPVLAQGQTESERVIRLIERQLNGGRELSPPYEPKRHLHPAPWREHQRPQPGSAPAVIDESTKAVIQPTTIGETEG
jgi:hypothetical protein